MRHGRGFESGDGSELHERVDGHGEHPNLDVLSVTVVRLVDVHDALEGFLEVLDVLLELLSLLLGFFLV